MAQLNKGTTYSTGDQVTAANLNALVDNATVLPGAITEQIAASSLTTSDSTLLAQSGGIRKATLGQILGLTDLSSYLKKDGSVAMTTGQQLTLGSTTQIAPLNAVSLGHLEANYLKTDGSTPVSSGQQLVLGTTSQYATFSPLNAVSRGYLGLAVPISGIVQASFDGRLVASTQFSFTFSKTGTTVVCTLADHGFIANNVIWATFSTTVPNGSYVINSVTQNTFTIILSSGIVSANGTGTFRKASPNSIFYNKNVTQVIIAGTSSVIGYWVNFSISFLDYSYSAVPTASFSGGSTGAYMIPDSLSLSNSTNYRTLRAVGMTPINVSGAVAESGIYSGCIVFGAADNYYIP